MNGRIFDRPVCIIAMPRSGSTLLFDLLAHHRDLRSWGDEAYPAWAAVDPSVAGEQGDAFDPVALDDGARRRAEWTMHEGVIRHHGAGLADKRGLREYRLPEKTPA